MKTFHFTCCVTLLLLLTSFHTASAQATVAPVNNHTVQPLENTFAVVQEPPALRASHDAFRELFNMQFEYATRILQLAEIMPEDLYGWRPEEEVRSVGEVYTHIASANIFFLQNAFGIDPPSDVDMSTLDSLTDKDEILSALQSMVNHVQESVAAIPDTALEEQIDMFGRSTNGEGILVFLLTHMSEHVGQSIAYARTNGVTPPWSE